MLLNPAAKRQTYPNVRARLRLTQTGPDLPDREYYMTFWLKDKRFHLCDEAGRDLSVLLGDLTAARGVGMLPQSMEDMMDIWSATQHPPNANSQTHLYGDLASDHGWVVGWDQVGWPIAATELAPLAEQILAPDPITLTPGQTVTRLGRPATEYHGFGEGEEAGMPYRSVITCIIAPPYVLFNHVHDVRITGLAYTREVVTLEEGVVTDAEVTPPAPTAK